MAVVNCRYFNGYKPCGKSETCDSFCPYVNVPSSHLLIVHLGALGAVLRSTALLAGIRRKFPGCHITWVTDAPAERLLENNPYIDRVLTTSSSDLLVLSTLEFDVGFVIDKSLKAIGVLKTTKADLVYGFTSESSTGAILPATSAAKELWQIGLSNRKKFYENKKTETQLIHEALELGTWTRDEYVLSLTKQERELAARRRSQWQKSAGQFLIGINTGCSQMIPYKKLSIENHRKMIQEMRTVLGESCRIVLLGGKEDTLRNQRIAHNLDVVLSPTENGLRDGIASVEACDIVITGDSLGMHLAIALKKWTVAWFGPTCAHEIDLYDRGLAVHSQAGCGPCWKRSCSNNPMCYDLVPLRKIIQGVQDGLRYKDLESAWPKRLQPAKI